MIEVTMDIIKPKQVAGKKVRKYEAKNNPALGNVRKWGQKLEKKSSTLKGIKKWAVKCHNDEVDARRKKGEEYRKKEEDRNSRSDNLTAFLIFIMLFGLFFLGIIFGSAG